METPELIESRVNGKHSAFIAATGINPSYVYMDRDIVTWARGRLRDDVSSAPDLKSFFGAKIIEVNMPGYIRFCGADSYFHDKNRIRLMQEGAGE